ncbi:GNAT family N-acetyltransferase [Paenibacillus sp. strain BS8-2]
MNGIRVMTIDDYDQLIALWERIEGLAISEADSRANIDMYLKRNAGLSLVYIAEGVLAGTILCGHDGRRGYLHHMAVLPQYRNQRIGQQMVELCMRSLEEEGIDKCHIFVLDDNETGQQFWSRTGWEKRSGFSVFSRDTHLV